MDKVIRRCIWVPTNSNKGVHLIKWGIMIKPKRLGHLNIRSTKLMNKALLAKLGWRKITYLEEFWCWVIRAKYRVEEEEGVHFKKR